MAYPPGTVVRLTFNTTVAGTPTNPTTLVFTIRDPTGTRTVYTYPTNITRLSAGVHYVDWVTSTAGSHVYRFVATGTAASAVEGSFDVHTLLIP